jgi:hypothetical protein
MIVQSSNRRRRIFWSSLALNRRRRFSTQWLSFVIVSHSSWLFRLWFVFAMSRSYHRMIPADFKTIKSFCRKISKRSCSLRSNFLNFFSRLKFLFRAQFLHAKVTLSDDRKYYKKDVMMIDENDQWVMRLFRFRSQSDDALILFDLIALFVLVELSCLSWSSFFVCLVEITDDMF